jgi:ACS family hexuronate transporter-like MFS transporter
LILSIAGGWLSGFLLGRGWTPTRARKTSLVMFALCVTPVSLALRADIWVAVVLIGIALASHHAWATTFYAVVSDIFPKPTVAAVAGLGGMAGSFGGMLFPAFCGWLLDRYRTLPGGETAGYAILFGMCSAAYLIAFAINHLLAPRYEPLQA